MTAILVLLIVATSLSLGLRATALVVDEPVHPMDRLALAAIGGGLITAVVLQVCASYGVLEMGLGLILSLSPVGPFDLTKWWFRSRGRRSGWLFGARRSVAVVGLRFAAVAGTVVAIAVAYRLIAAISL